MKKNKTVSLVARCDIVMRKAQMKVDEWIVSVEVTEEQYNRIVDSYSTGKFSQMNEDEDILDLWEMFDKAGKTSEKQILKVDYPLLVQKGSAFDEVYKLQNKKWTKKEIEEFARQLSDAEDIASKTDECYERLDADFEEEIERQNAVDALNAWMLERGFAAGEFGCPLLDEEGWAVECVDVGWPNGINVSNGYTKPVAVQFFHTTPKVLMMAKNQGFEVFESIDEFKKYIEDNYMGDK